MPVLGLDISDIGMYNLLIAVEELLRLPHIK